MVAFDAVGPSSAGTAFTGTTGTWSHTNNGNAILVGCSVFAGISDTITAVSYGGVALSKLGFVGTTNGGVSFWGRIGGLPTGTNTVSVTKNEATNNCNAGSISASGAGSFGTVFNNSNTGANTSLAITVNGTTTGGLIVSVAAWGSGTAGSVSGATLQWSHLGSVTTSADNAGGATVASTGGGANQTITWSQVGADEWQIFAVELLPAAGGAQVQKYSGGQTQQRRRSLRSQKLLTPPDVIAVPASSTPEPVVVSQQPNGKWYGPTPTIVSVAPQPPPVQPTSTPPPVVQAEPVDPAYLRQNQPIISSGREDPDDFISKSQTTVVSSQPSQVWTETPTTTVLRNTLQDPPQLTTPEAVVVTSQPDARYGPTKTTIISNPQAPPPVVGVTPSPIVVTSQPAAVWLRTQAPFDTRNTTQDPPQLTTPDPVVVTGQPPRAWLEPKAPQVIRNPQPPVTPPTRTPAPVVVGLQGIPVGHGGRVVVRRNGLFVQTWRDPQHLGGSVSDANHLGGTVTGNRLGGTVTGNRFSGTVIGNRFSGTTTVVHTLSGSGTVQRTFSGTATVVDPWGGSLDEWTMQEVDINLGEFNDETLAVAVLNNGSAYDLTGKTLQALFKTAAGVSDSDPSTITLSSPSSGITITNAPGGLANIAIPRADLANASITFWRLDVVSGGLQNTAIYGKVAITPL